MPLRHAGLIVLVAALPAASAAPAAGGAVTRGALRFADAGRVVECPLRHTDVRAEITGFLARVVVTQTFENPRDQPIEAVYVFPLPHTAAVDGMTLEVAERRVESVVERRAAALGRYRAALAGGRTASLVEQERPNVFTHSVGNVPPGQSVRVEIRYLDTLAYDQGGYEFHVPMVVGPRYLPAAPLAGGRAGHGWSADTTRVRDASRITPPTLRPGERYGHDVSVAIRLDAGVPIRGLRTPAHETRVERDGPSRARIALAGAGAIPNRDFVLRYDVAGSGPELAAISHGASGEDGTFLLMMQPGATARALGPAPPRDLCFLIDVSGSMSGRPTETVVALMRELLARMRPRDRIQVITFADSTRKLFRDYVPADAATLERALGFAEAIRAGGGTEMLAGIRALLADPVDPERVRIAVLLSDGYIGNEAEIVREVGRRTGDRVRFWAVGIGAAPNRFLIDGIAAHGGGLSATIGLGDPAGPVAARVAGRLQRAQLAGIEIDWGVHDVYDTYPARIPELWPDQPLVLFGRFRGGPSQGVVRLSGSAEGRRLQFPFHVSLAGGADHPVLSGAWARRKIAELADQLTVHGATELEQEITALALDHQLVSDYTSLVAVDAGVPLQPRAAPPRRVLVPLPLPEGTRYHGFFGDGIVTADAAAVRGPEPRTIVAAADRASARSWSRGVARASLEEPEGIAGGLAESEPRGPRAAAADLPQGAPPRGRLVDAGDRAREAQQALVAARDLLETGAWQQARARLQLAHALDVSAAGTGHGPALAGAIAASWARSEGQRRARAMRALPALALRTGLVIGNEELLAALAQVCAAAGIPLDVDTGALPDAMALLDREAVRVAYVDLRGADAAQALSWLLHPAGLDWRVADGRIRVSSSRRLPGESSWLYSTAGFSPRESAALATLASRALGAQDATLRHSPSAALLPGGRLLVLADSHGHALVGALLATLRGEPGAAAGLPRPLRDEAVSLAAHTASRFQAGAEGRRLLRERAAWRRASLALHDASWRLLTAAFAGHRDPEAVAQLDEAWRHPRTRERLAWATSAGPARAAWAVALALAGAPDDPALRRLAGRVFADITALTAEPRALGAGRASTRLYLELLRRRPGGAVPAAVRTGLTPLAHGELESDPEPWLPVARVLFSPDPGGPALARERREILAQLAGDGFRGDDGLLLAALALRGGGGRDWQALRRELASIAASRLFSGAVLRAVNRLDGAAAAARQPAAAVSSPRLLESPRCARCARAQGGHEHGERQPRRGTAGRAGRGSGRLSAVPGAQAGSLPSDPQGGRADPLHGGRADHRTGDARRLFLRVAGG